ncbi:MAG: type VI secretion system baseplate subunit TssE [Candidatus Eisenbacteria bacterium]
MARELSLLDRLKHPDREDRRSVDADPGRLAQSVLRNLERLLNSRHGSAPTRPDYGIPSIEDVLHGGSDALRDLTGEIKASIEAFEPRLRNVRVRLVPRGEEATLLRFDITAELVVGGKRSRVHFETRIEDSGRMTVKE